MRKMRFLHPARFMALLLLLLATHSLLAQLDTIHWLPPMHARTEWGPQYLYLSTPDSVPFPVSVRDGGGNLIFTVNISNANPFRYNLGADAFTKTLVTEDELGMPLQDKGLVIDGPRKFYAYFRAHSNSEFHAGNLTCKGRAALGTTFRVGQLIQANSESILRCNFVSWMATEDDTDITLSGFSTGTHFRFGDQDVPSYGTPITIHLQKGESAVYSNYVQSSMLHFPPNGLMGALVKSNKPIAVNCGSWVGAPVEFEAHDMGIDQIVPVERVGTEYILCKGNGSDILEHPIVIAHYNNTKVWLNGNPNPVGTLQAGDYMTLNINQFTNGGNMYVETSEPVFMYQMIGGTSEGQDAMRTAGLIFVPPVSCAIPNTVNNIFEPNRIGDMLFDGGLMIVAMRDSQVIVRLDGQSVYFGPPVPVQGAPDFVTYRKLDIFKEEVSNKTLSVDAHGAVQVAMFGRNKPASYAAFFSGFSKTEEPNLKLSVLGDGVCPDTLVATGLFDGVQWVYEDSILQFGPDTFLVTHAPGKYKAIGYRGVCRKTDFAADSLDLSFNSPQFPFQFETPSCYGMSDGQIQIGNAFGGFPPYQYSIDHGISWSDQSSFFNLTAGNYNMLVRDSTGCYNRPMPLQIKQPDSLKVEIAVLHMQIPLHSFQPVELEAVPSRRVVATQWLPLDSTGCENCLNYLFHPEFDTWVSVLVYDSIGCTAIDSIFIKVEPNVFAPNIIRLGSDGLHNDHFMLYSKDDVPIHHLSVFDRWGNLVFDRQEILTNHYADGWDGRVRGRQLQPGVYVYRASVEVEPGRIVELQGDFTLVR
ncbi:MAG: gliding motility-associated C-terminal domain-containing protein [Lewinellaceae bacterium]|nr:gliding motility-associated C-terminal domain-containing protein [Lewinellaceae bacterium]